MVSTLDRVVGCLTGVATGDAVGKQTETLSHEQVRRWYPDGVRGFEGPEGAIIPRYRGNAKREWRIGETTDDTERTIAVARAVIAHGDVSHGHIGREMLGCRKSVHPGVTSLWEFHQAADPMRIATRHDGCGAAIRVAPVGILYESRCLDRLVNGAREASISTHGGPLAIAAAAATAVAISAAIDDAGPQEILELAARAATIAERRWFPDSPPRFAAAIRAAHDGIARPGPLRPEHVAACCFPDRPSTIVPLALALGITMTSADDAILLAANVGGDSDSVASMAGAILGARFPNTVNQGWCDVVERVNAHGLAALAGRLAALRRGCPGSGHPAD
jgi:ADP-ribosylglycohydrolase